METIVDNIVYDVSKKEIMLLELLRKSVVWNNCKFCEITIQVQDGKPFRVVNAIESVK